jgi:hypothetical protein
LVRNPVLWDENEQPMFQEEGTKFDTVCKVKF